MNIDTTPQTDKPQEHKAENLLVNLLFNIIIPTVILTKLSSEEYLGVVNGIILALIFPLAYGVRDAIGARRINLFSVLGIVSIFLTGGISLMGLDPKYLAIKEALVPSIFGLATLVSTKTPYPLVKTFIYNDKILDTQMISEALQSRGNSGQFEKLLNVASYLVAGSFFLSAALNYILAITIVTSHPGSVEYNAQLGKMTALSFPVIAVPATLVMLGALLYLLRGIVKLTGLSFEGIVKHQKKD